MASFAKRHEDSLGIATAGLIGGLALILISIVWAGFWIGLALSVLWGWFVVPLFGLPAITLWKAYGLVLVVRTMQTHTHVKKDEKFGEVMARVFLGIPFAAGLTLLVGWLVKAWV